MAARLPPHLRSRLFGAWRAMVACESRSGSTTTTTSSENNTTTISKKRSSL